MRGIKLYQFRVDFVAGIHHPFCKGERKEGTKEEGKSLITKLYGAAGLRGKGEKDERSVSEWRGNVER